MKEKCPNCIDPDPSIAPMTNGECGVCGGRGYIEWHKVGRIVEASAPKESELTPTPHWEIEYDRHYKGGGKKIITHKMRKDFIRQQLEKLIDLIPDERLVTSNVNDMAIYADNRELKAQLRKEFL